MRVDLYKKYWLEGLNDKEIFVKMNRDEVKLVFDNEADRDKVADQYGTYGNGVCSNDANIEKNDDSYES